MNHLHADAFNLRVFEESEWDWVRLCNGYSFGWVTARVDGRLVGFVNVLWDGLVHAWIQDEMVASDARRRGIGVPLIHVARDAARGAGCEWLHVDFEDDLKPFYENAAGFTPTNGGLMDLTVGVAVGSPPLVAVTTPPHEVVTMWTIGSLRPRSGVGRETSHLDRLSRFRQ